MSDTETTNKCFYCTIERPFDENVQQLVRSAVMKSWPECIWDIETIAGSGKVKSWFFTSAASQLAHTDDRECPYSGPGCGCQLCIGVEWESDNDEDAGECVTYITIVVVRDGSQDRIARDVIEAIGAKITIPEWVKCILAHPVKENTEARSICGREIGFRDEGASKDEIGFYEFAFVDAQHALSEAQRNGRLLICMECSKKAIELLKQQTAEMSYERSSSG